MAAAIPAAGEAGCGGGPLLISARLAPSALAEARRLLLGDVMAQTAGMAGYDGSEEAQAAREAADAAAEADVDWAMQCAGFFSSYEFAYGDYYDRDDL